MGVTSAIFAGDPDTFTFSIHQGDLYPIPKEKSSLDGELAAGTGDAEYYDRLGGMKLTERGVGDRDTARLHAATLRLFAGLRA
ncbi:MAG: hypothetical protein A2506_02010 [Elusimicrobia bacterium RIFOXYD12_FULL_66_9]|nr:MAG: hypothetical protein A2506_02010 [Elusimicrobia bacterium RIFOXYD12_FULL_66_9]